MFSFGFQQAFQRGTLERGNKFLTTVRLASPAVTLRTSLTQVQSIVHRSRFGRPEERRRSHGAFGLPSLRCRWSFRLCCFRVRVPVEGQFDQSIFMIRC